MFEEREVQWPAPQPEPDQEPSHPWARHERKPFDWDAERKRQKGEGELWVESDEERDEREASILPKERRRWR